MKQKSEPLLPLSLKKGLRNCIILSLAVMMMIIYSGCTPGYEPKYINEGKTADSVTSQTITLPYYCIPVAQAKNWLNYDHNYSKVTFTPCYLKSTMSLMDSSIFLANVLDKRSVNFWKQISYEEETDTLRTVPDTLMATHKVTYDFIPFAISNLEIKTQEVAQLLGTEAAQRGDAFLIFVPDIEENPDTKISYLYFNLMVFSKSYNTSGPHPQILMTTPNSANPSPPSKPSDYQKQ